MPANQNPKSTHLPELAGAIDMVTGSLIVDTGLRNVQSFAVTLAQAPTATDASVAGLLAEPTPGGHQKLTLIVVAADGVTPGVTATKVSWTALGK